MGKKSAKQATNFLGTSALTRPLFALGAASVLLGAGPAQALDPNTLPQNPNVVGGKDSFSQSGNTLNVNQHTNRTVIDWRSFDVGSKAQVNFNQPGTSSIAVNRVNGSTNPSDIEGGLHANGQVWILNPNGVFFGKSARVDAAGIVATTANINDKAFMAGSNTLKMKGADHGSVVNEGRITVGNAGLAAFVAPSVRNSGVIHARLGRVALAAGTTYTLDLAGDHLVELGLGSVNAVVDESGRVVNPGGTVTLTAKAASQVVNSVVNVSGVVSASSAMSSGGTVILGADTVNTTQTASISADGGGKGAGGTIKAVAKEDGNYAGTFSAKGGAKSGNGGKIETSGHDVSFGHDVKVTASAHNGKAGTWLVDPTDITIDGALAGTIESTLAGGTSMNVTTSAGTGGNGDITLTSSVNAAATGGADLTLFGRHLSAASGKTISISGTGSSLILDVNAVNPLADVTGQSTNWISDALGMIGTVSGGTTINLGTGTYAGGAVVNKANVTIDGHSSAKIKVVTGYGLNITADNATVQNLEIVGPISGDYENVDWSLGSNTGTGIGITGSPSSFNISNNNIHDIRTGIAVLGNSVSGSITGNKVENTKGAIIIQYSDGADYTITGNREGAVGNEWGIVLNTNTSGHVATAEPLADQAKLLLLSQNNNGLVVLDRFYGSANRTEVTVDAASTATAADDAVGYNGNGLGSARQALSTIQAGVNAVVAGGTVNVLAGNYTLTGELDITKSLSLIGAGQGVTNITSTSTGYGIFVDADNTTLSNFTYNGSSTGTYSFKIQAAPGSASNVLQNFEIDHVTINGSKKTGLDLNGVHGATIDHVTVNGTVAGTGIALTDSANVTITNATTSNNAWGGLAIYENNAAFSQQVNNVIVNGTNTFNESKPIYMEDQSASKDFGSVTIGGGYNYGVRGKVDDSGFLAQYTWFQKTQQAAIDFAAAVGTSIASVEGWTGTALNNIFTVGTSTGGTALSIAAANAEASNGAIINVLAGNYTLSGELDVTKSLTLNGVGVGATNITSNSTGYGINVTADNVSLKNFTFHGPSAVSSSTYGIKVTPDTGVASDRLLNFDIENVTIDRGYRTGLDLNGVVGATIKNVSVSNIAHGNGIALTDSANVTITGTTTSNNLWGGLALYQHNSFYDQQLNNITVNGSNQFNEANGIYLEDESDGVADPDHGASVANLNAGTLNIAGYSYVAADMSNSADQYTFFQKTQQGAIDFATDSTANSGHLSLAHTYVEGWTGSALNNIFTVGYNTAGTKALSINTAISAASSGATVNVLAGTYNESVVLNKANMTLKSVTPQGAVIDAGGSDFGISVSSTSGNLGTLTVDGFTVQGWDSVGILQGMAAGPFATFRVLNNVVMGPLTGATANGNGIQVSGNGSVVSGNEVHFVHLNSTDWSGSGIIVVNGSNITVKNNLVDTADVGIAVTNWSNTAGMSNIVIDGNTVTNSGDEGVSIQAYEGSVGGAATGPISGVTITDNTITGTPSAVGIWDYSDWVDVDPTHATGAKIGDWSTVVADISGNTFADNVTQISSDFIGANVVPFLATNTFDAAAVNANAADTIYSSLQTVVDNASAGDTIDTKGTFGEDIAVGTQLAFNFDNTTVDSFTLASGGTGSSLTGDLAAKGAITLNGAASLGGDLTAAAIALNGAITLTGNTTLDTSAANGAIKVASVNGATAGGQSLSIDAGKGAVSLGNLGAATRLGAVSDASKTTLTGATYNANSFLFGGDVTLTAATTTLNTTQSSSAAGDITFKGDIFGTTDGGQSLALIAGSGAGAVSANGDITLQNAGTSSVELGNLTVSGDNFTALTVWLDGNYTSTLTGNQVFAADTLHTGGNVNSTVGGDASGHIVSGGNVNIAANGDVSGDISGTNVALSGDDVNSTVTASNSASVTGNTVEGSYTADNVSITANNNVNAAVDATSFTLAAQGGTVSGTWVTIDSSGSGLVNVNGQPVVGEANFNPNQLVVEGFALPAGTTIGPNGELILPQGVLLGLLSPGGGKPKMILVHTVQDLGQLLADGYSVIVIDLSNRDKGKLVQLASN